MHKTAPARAWTATLALFSLLFLLALGAWAVFSWPLVATASSEMALWYVFAFCSGLLLVGASVGLPLALALVPHSSPRRSLLSVAHALAYGLGVALLYSVSGFALAFFAQRAYAAFDIPTYRILAPSYLFVGISGYILALADLGFVPFTHSRLSERVPNLARRGAGGWSAFLLGMSFCTLAIQTSTFLVFAHVTAVGDPIYGWSLLFAHGLGLLVALVFAALVAFSGKSAARMLSIRRFVFVEVAAWVCAFVSATLLHVGLARLAQSPMLAGSFVNVLAGKAVFVVLLVLPLWAFYVREWRASYGSARAQLRELCREEEELRRERRALEFALHYRDGDEGARLREIDLTEEKNARKRNILESAARHNVRSREHGTLPTSFARRAALGALTTVVVLTIVTVLAVYAW